VQPRSVGIKEDLAGGRVYLFLVPKIERADEYITPEKLRISEDLRAAVQRELDERRLLTVRVDISEPEYVWVAVDVAVVPAANADPERVRADVERRLYHFLNPIVGGPYGNGWPFGRTLYPSDVYTCLQPVRGIEYIETLKLIVMRANGELEVNSRLLVPTQGVIASGQHRVHVDAAVRVEPPPAG
jgi:hypothetical protein